MKNLDFGVFHQGFGLKLKNDILGLFHVGKEGCGLADDDMWHHSRGHEDILDFTWSKCRHLPSATWMDILEEVIRICLYYDK